MREENGRFESITTDHLDTPTEMYDEHGNLTWKAELDIFGVCTIERGSRAQCPFRWPGQYEDEETGLYYNRFRYYDPSEGVYVSQDPIRLAGGLALYGYVGDPLVIADPLGLDWNYRLRNAHGDVYYYGRASDNDTPAGVMRRHSKTRGADGARFIRGSDAFEPIAARGTGRSTSRGIEQLGIAKGATAIGRRKANGGRVRGNNIRGVDPGNQRARGYLAAGRSFLTRAELKSVEDMATLTPEQWAARRKC